MAILRAHLLRSSRLATVCTFALSSFITITPARAQFGLDTFLHQLFFGNSNTHHKPHHPHRHRPDSDEDDSALSDFPDDEETRELAKLAPPAREQLALLKSVNASDLLGAVGSSDAGSGNAAIGEADRDYTTMVDQLMQTLKSKLSDSGHQGDVTETAVLDALTEAILQAKLDRFETFIGENWSAERLRGMIIKRVTDEIGGLFEGNNRGAVSMADLNSMIKKSAREVYARLFETSELLAANRSATLFMQRLYQARGDLVKGDVREDTEGLAAKSRVGRRRAFPICLQPRRSSLHTDLSHAAHHLRLPVRNVESIAGSGSGILHRGDRGRLIDTERKQCTKWVLNQMLGVDGGVRPQVPLPLRVIWTADGPKEDPSMYGHASDQS